MFIYTINETIVLEVILMYSLINILMYLLNQKEFEDLENQMQ